jgi:hypothetical protein
MLALVSPPTDSLACLHESIFCHNLENNCVLNATKSDFRSRSKETQVWSSKAVATVLKEEKKQDFDAKFWMLPGLGRWHQFTSTWIEYRRVEECAFTSKNHHSSRWRSLFSGLTFPKLSLEVGSFHYLAASSKLLNPGYIQSIFSDKLEDECIS